MRLAVAAGALLIGVTACKTAPMDPYARAQLSVNDGQLLRALESLDQVPPVDPHYPEARTMAQAVERRMRAGQEMLLQGLLLRTEWRDEEAIRYFEWALEIWPRIEGAEELIRATRNRMTSLAQVGGETYEPGRVASTLPVGMPGPETEPVGVEVETPPQPDPAAGREGSPGELAAVENLLSKGELQEALARLEDLYLLDSDSTNVRRTLARVLHQRALVRYGQGYLEPAIADWARVAQLDQKLTEVAEFLQAARAELAERRRP